VDPEQAGAVRQWAVAQQEASEIHREEAAPVRQRRNAEGDQTERQRHHRVEAAG
jgi:hypothetical protein